MLKRLTYFNLVYGMIFFVQVINSFGPTSLASRINAIGLILTIWHNWESLKVIKGQKKKLSKSGFIFGLLTILFAGLLLFDSVLRFLDAMDVEDMRGALLFLIALEFIFATTVTVQAIWTIKKYRRKSTPANK